MTNLIGPKAPGPTHPTPFRASGDRLLDGNGMIVAVLTDFVADWGLLGEIAKAVNEYYGRTDIVHETPEEIEELTQEHWEAGYESGKKAADDRVRELHGELRGRSFQIEEKDARIEELEYTLANLDDIRKADEQRIRELEEEIRNKEDYGPVSMPPGDTRSFPEGQRVTDIRNANESVCTGERKIGGVVVVRWGLDDEVDYVDPRYLRRVWENIERPSDLPEDVPAVSLGDWGHVHERDDDGLIFGSNTPFTADELPVVEVLEED